MQADKPGVFVDTCRDANVSYQCRQTEEWFLIDTGYQNKYFLLIQTEKGISFPVDIGRQWNCIFSMQADNDIDSY